MPKLGCRVSKLGHATLQCREKELRDKKKKEKKNYYALTFVVYAGSVVSVPVPVPVYKNPSPEDETKMFVEKFIFNYGVFSTKMLP